MEKVSGIKTCWNLRESGHNPGEKFEIYIDGKLYKAIVLDSINFKILSSLKERILHFLAPFRRKKMESKNKIKGDLR